MCGVSSCFTDCEMETCQEVPSMFLVLEFQARSSKVYHQVQMPYRQASMSKAGHGSPTRPQPVLNNGKQPSPEPRSQQPTQQMNLSCVNTKTTQLLFRILPVTLYGPNRRVETYALLDEASPVTMIDEVLLKDLGVNGERNLKYELKNVHAVDGLDLPMQTLNQDYLQVIIPQPRFPVEAYTNAVPRILIGLDHKYLVVPSSTWETSNRGPYVAVTRLGWDVSGTFHKHQHTSAPKPCLFAATDTDEVHKMVSEYFKLENMGVKPTPPAPSDDDIRAQSILNETTVELLGRYQTGLIWKRDNVNLPSSYKMALNRLETVERKMERDKQFAQEYKGMINDYISKGYARRVEREEDIAVGSGKIWYLPHFAVTNPNKPGKIRLVFDAAAKVGNVSLNSELLKGPQHYRPLFSVLFHFREGAVAVTGDIKEMFLQIYVQPQDRRSQRFLWRDGQREADVYEMQVMTFGAACSPSAAHHVMTLNAMRHQQVDPRAVKAITDYHYVDDYVDSFATEDEAISVSARVRDIHKTGGFELRRFQSNSPKVVESLGQEGTTNPVGWAEAEEKILGLYWQPATDEFRFNVKYQRIKHDVPTKKQFLSLIMSTLDPMGFLSCFTITGKLLLREIWRRNVLWDEPLPKELNSAFQKWRHQLEGVGLFRCPRHYFGSEMVKSIKLHVFTDASESAYAAVAYWRATYQNGDVQVSFVCGKTKCAPMRTMSVPRLELQAAVLGTRLMNAVKSGHCMETEDAILWTDAKTVLRWICSTHRRYKQFVGNRVTEILESTDASQWRWVPTADNVADEATRPQGQVDFSQKSRWMCGPKFLQQPQDLWPQSTTDLTDIEVAADVEESPCEFALVVANDEFIQFQRFSEYNRLLRTMTWVLRFVCRCRRQQHEHGKYGLTAAECAEAELVLVRVAQREAFPDELHRLYANRPVQPTSELKGLLPYVDDLAILRASGRIDAALCLPYGARRPIILTHRHPLTDLIVRHYHVRMKHQNVNATITEIRMKFWITKVRRVLQRVIRNCGVCKLQRATPTPPLMGPLPEDRLKPGGWPFEYTGLDYFGPLLVTVGRRQEKRWVALFTCLRTRAIHLELAHDLSTDSCILAMRNFMCRRGPVRKLGSDNGKNFIGADREAKRFTDVFEADKIQDELATRCVEWIFNCPLNPAEGGVWERMVRCVKRVLAHTVKDVAPKEHVLQSLLIEAANIVNSRPLTHMPISVDQEAPLMPNDLLKGTSNIPDTPAESEELPKPCETRKQWRMARLLRDRFWKREMVRAHPANQKG
ncbi:uncharacterized protein LOC124461276 [Drosophila willistoni]|uniref:uncharacterized protein LOC124461276 n=1 Tax=Drosophila willistoni TaxID=7260 RepID=UPI001F076271|nr:uncharacterized protein LOC124461276 [Drosophila willistoni]